VLALLAASGHARVPVHGRPRVAVLSTGDELVPVGESLRPGTIHDSNGPMLQALARSAGAQVRSLGIVRDDLDAVLGTLREAAATSDLVIVTGGVSVGAHDVVKEAFDRVGRVDLWRVAVQPGKPLAFGRVDACLLVGLPGNPVSSFVTFEIFVRPMLRSLAGAADPTDRRRIGARLAGPVTSDRDRRAFLRVTLRDDADGPIAALAGGQGSHVLSALAAADGLAIVPEGVESLPAGAEVEVWLLEGVA
jgi:molybdopterin molybdotransferase